MRARLRDVLSLAALAGAVLLGAAPAVADAEIRGADLGVLARCIAESGALFYGAHWCPYCRKQKEDFAGYDRYLPYVECYDGARAGGMNDRCKAAGIKTFPTWVFPDGTVKTGARTPLALARATGCLEE